MTSQPAPTWDAFAEGVGQRLRATRKAQGLSQDTVAGRAKVATFTYQKLEKGISRPGAPANPRLTTLLALCKALDVPVEEVLAGPWPDEIPTVGRNNDD